MQQKIFTFLPEKMDEINYNIAGAAKNIQQDLAITSYELNEKVNKIDKKLDKAIKPRKKADCHFLAQVQGYFCFVTKYDDGSHDVCYALDNLRGAFSVSKVFIEDTSLEPLYLIEFRENQRYFWGLANDLTGKGLYEEFVKNGVRFSASFPQSKINTMLYEFFAPLITNTENNIPLPSHAGFFNGRFVCSETFPPIELSCLKNLPIRQKSFPEYPLEEDTFSTYCEAILKIENPLDRFMVAVYPFLSMISSLLTEYGYALDFSLNIVNLSSVPSPKMCELFQIFSRTRIMLHNLDVTRKNLDNLLANLKDEVFIIDNTTNEEYNYYRANTSRQKLLHILSVLNEQKLLSSENRTVNAGLVTISSSYCLRNSVYNMIFSPKQNLFENDQLSSSHCMERMFFNFIKFLENQTDIERTNFFLKKRNEKSNSGKILSLIYDLLTAFWAKYGLDFASELLLPVFDFDCFLGSTEYADSTEEIAMFIDTLRMSVSDYPIVKKKRSCLQHNCIMYTDDYVWFPVDIMKNICNNAKIMPECRRILMELRKLGLLITDKNSLSRVMQINTQRQEMYMLKREILTRPGEIDFIYLGKAVQ